MLTCSIHPGNKDGHASTFGKDFKAAKVTLPLLAEVITEAVWSPIVWQDGVRRADRFMWADFLVLDFDSGEYKLHECKDDFADTQHIIAPTKSHTDDHHRFRLIVPFEARVDNLRWYAATMHAFMRKFACDQQCKDGARFFYPSKSLYSVQTDTECYTADCLAYSVEGKDEKRGEALFESCRKFADQGRIPHDIRRIFDYGIYQHNFPGARNNTVWKVALRLILMDYPLDFVIKQLSKRTDLPEQETLHVIKSAARTANDIRRRNDPRS